MEEVASNDERVAGDSQGAITVSVAAPSSLKGLTDEHVRTLPEQDEGKSGNGLVDMFRDSSLHMSSTQRPDDGVAQHTGVVRDRSSRTILMDDLALVKLFGVHLVIVVSTRVQFETSLASWA